VATCDCTAIADTTDKGGKFLPYSAYSQDAQRRGSCQIQGEKTLRRGPRPSRTLSVRECEVYNLVAEGLSQKEIGFRLELSSKTINCHVVSIARKLRIPTPHVVPHAAVARAGAEWARLAEEEAAYPLAARIRQSYGFEDVRLAEVLRGLEVKADLAA
jgi:DNA-binding NarL/FixJ family response regulator